MKQSAIDRRAFLGIAAGTCIAGAGLLSACSQSSPDQVAPDAEATQNPTSSQNTTSTGSTQSEPALQPLPESSPDPESQFGVDLNINMETIDEWLGRDDVVYRDMRLIKDPADYAAIGGSSDLDFVLEGFKVVPFPYVGTLQTLPVEGAYTGDKLFDITWNEDGTVASAEPLYEQSMMILEDLFPQDKAIFLMCGGAGYAGQMKQLLIFLGWDPALLYNVGGAWDYAGYHSVQIIDNHTDPDNPEYFLWRLDMVPFDFTQYTPLAS